MKRMIAVLALAAMMFVNSLSLAEGFFPTPWNHEPEAPAEAAVTATSYEAVMQVRPLLERATEDGGLCQTYVDVLEEEYTAFGEALNGQGYALADSRFEADSAWLLVERDGISFTVEYWPEEYRLVVTYPAGVEPERMPLRMRDVRSLAAAYGLEEAYRMLYESGVQRASADIGQTACIRSDGTVQCTGQNKFGECEVERWRDIRAVAAGGCHTVGLKADGTVVVAGGLGDGNYGQCAVESWHGIAAVSAGYATTVGLKADGTVVAAGYNEEGQCNVDGWTDIVAVAAAANHTVGLKADGTVVAVGWNKYHQCDVGQWTDIVAVAATKYLTFGLRSDGTVAVAGKLPDKDAEGQELVGDWRDIVDISAGPLNTCGLRADGTLAVLGYDYYGAVTQASGWQDIACVDVGALQIVALTEDGSVVAAGKNEADICAVDGWTWR